MPRNPFDGRPAPLLLNTFLAAAAVCCTAATIAFLASSTHWTITALCIALAAFPMALMPFRAFRALGDLYEHPDANAMRRRIKIYASVIIFLMMALLIAHFTRRYALGHRHEQLVPWWFVYFLSIALNPMQAQLRPPSPPRSNNWRAELKPLHSDHWGR